MMARLIAGKCPAIAPGGMAAATKAIVTFLPYIALWCRAAAAFEAGASFASQVGPLAGTMLQRQRAGWTFGMKIVRIAAIAAVLGFSGGLWPAAADAAQTGLASYYKHGKRTANGERFDPHGMTAAHRTFPFGSRVLVTNLKNGKSVIVRINDRGPFTKGRVIDLSLGAAKVVGLTQSGVARVKVVRLD
jgi:rare lipoprotein A